MISVGQVKEKQTNKMLRQTEDCKLQVILHIAENRKDAGKRSHFQEHVPNMQYSVDVTDLQCKTRRRRQNNVTFKAFRKQN